MLNAENIEQARMEEAAEAGDHRRLPRVQRFAPVFNKEQTRLNAEFMALQNKVIERRESGLPCA